MLSSQYCFVVEDDNGICGYAVGVPDADDYHNKMTLSWLPEMKVKYPAESDDVMEETSIQVLTEEVAHQPVFDTPLAAYVHALLLPN